jgi:hypothetical protein
MKKSVVDDTFKEIDVKMSILNNETKDWIKQKLMEHITEAYLRGKAETSEKDILLILQNFGKDHNQTNGLKIKAWLDKWNEDRNKNVIEEYATITLEGDFVDKVKKTELNKWMDDFFSKKLKNKPKKYSQKLWDQLKEYEVHIDGNSFCLPYYDEKLSEKWF